MFAVFVQSSQMPGLPPWVFALCFLLAAICFAPQPLRRPVPRLMICAVVLAAAFSAVGYAVYYVPYDWCSADQSSWYAWFQCLVS